MELRAAMPADLHWLIARSGAALSSKARGVTAYDARGVRGVVCWDGWTENAAYVHMASDTPMVWRYLPEPACRHFYAHYGLMIGVIPERHRASVELAAHLGFREASRIKDGWARGEDLLVMEMRREDCRWLEGSAE